MGHSCVLAVCLLALLCDNSCWSQQDLKTTDNAIELLKTGNSIETEQREDGTETTTTLLPLAVPVRTPYIPPRGLQVTKVSRNSIRLQWNFTRPVDSKVDGFRIFYVHQSYEDVKTIRTEDTGDSGRLNDNTHIYELAGLEPYTVYEIWVKAIVDGEESPDSPHISANTDIAQPSSPWLSNASCYDTGVLYIEWKKPERFDKSVDYYTIFFKKKSDDAFSKLSVEAKGHEETQQFFIQKLEGSATYLVKVCAGTKSLAPPYPPIWGEASRELEVFLPEENCDPLSSPRVDVNEPGMADGGSELSVGMVVGAVCAIIFLILACLGFIMWRSHFKKAYYNLEDIPRTMAPVGFPEWESIQGPDGREAPIPISDLSSHVSKMHMDSDHGFAKEYTEIQKNCIGDVNLSHEHCSHQDNKCKNRYLNIVAYDHSRVALAPLPGLKKTSDYINANFIDGFQKYHAYIGTQGPLEDTCEAFWRMVWEQNVFVIVMITNLTERGRRKCDMYWPKDSNPVAYGFIEVSLEKERVMANYTVRTLKIKHMKLKRKKGVGGEREVFQYHYTSWPDHGVPAHPLPVLSFIKQSAAKNPLDGGPIIVHCSAGVGRTGTYIAIDTQMQQIEATGHFNVFGFLKHIRKQRNFLVQTEEQYIFIHDALLEAQKSGQTEIAAKNIGKEIERLGTPISTLPQEKETRTDVEITEEITPLDLQFKLIVAFKTSDFHYISAGKACNSSKNRSFELMPVESARVSLSPKPGVEGSDYINATWIHGHNKLREFVITQHPTVETRSEFWRMLWDHNAQTIVLLTALNEEDGYTVFWPLIEDEFDFETFRVKYIEKATHEGHSTFDFVLSSCQDDYELAVRIIHCSEWTNCYNHNGTNWDLEQVFNVLKLVQDWHLEYQRGPLVVVDRFGGTEAATFCALTTLCNQLETDGSIDVYQVAKLYHNKRPGIWKSKDDVLFLYKCMETLVSSSHPINPCQPTGHNSTIVPTSPISPTDNNQAELNKNGITLTSVPNGDLSKQTSSVGRDRRHSLSEGGGTSEDGASGGGGGGGNNNNRRYSLPPSTSSSMGGGSEENNHGCVINMPKDEEEDEDEDDIVSETVALTTTTVC